MAEKLTRGAIHTMMSGGKLDQPVVQMVNFRRIVTQKQERYRLLISDGQHTHSFAMLATQLNDLITGKTLESNAIIQLDRYICNTVKTQDQQNKNVIVILEVSVLTPGSEVGQKLGNPVPYDDKAPPADSYSAPSAPTPASTAGLPAAARPFPSKPINNNIIPQSHVGGGMGGHANVFPIASLTPYQNKWMIKARVTNKSDVRFWSNSRGEGKLFSLELLDESGEIRATAFKDQCDKFYDLLEIGKVYYISRGTLKTANKQYTSVKNDYEMTFNNETTVEPCQESSDSIPQLQFNFIPISDLVKCDKDSVVDVIGVCKQTGDVQTVMARSTKRELKKRDLMIVDTSNTEVQLTLWGSQAESFEGESHPVLAIKGARISDFNGRSLSTLSQSLFQVNPDIQETYRLKGWYENEGAHQEATNISGQRGAGPAGPASFKLLGEAKLDNLGVGEKPDYYSCAATVIQFRSENALYQACPQESCNKKVIDQNNGMYRCEKCNQEFPDFKWRLMLSLNIADSSDNQWVTCFQESAETLIGTTADDLGNMRTSDPDGYQNIFKNATFSTWHFRLRVKMENYNEESRLKHVVVSVSALSMKEHCERLRQEIQEMGGAV